MSNPAARELLLAARLDRLSRSYAPAASEADPIRSPASYERAEDREVAAWIASAFAYGRVETILSSVDRILGALGPQPSAALDRIGNFRRFAREELAGFRHRFHSGLDASALLYAIARARAEAGSVRAFFEREYRPEDRDVGGLLSRVTQRILAFDWRPALRRRTPPEDSAVRFFFPDPVSGSACKRWNLYLRWMVRKDALDFGLWKGIPTSRLVIPTDTHVHRVARRLDLTRRKAADWKTAREITDRLARFDPDDPVRYDYALCEIGAMGICRATLAASKCDECPVNEGCPAGRRRLRLHRIVPAA
ncbi:MAG TPA: TIGR02757 family protein [Thermoanaerobaculia bacterium]